MSTFIRDDFAGPGGWSEGLRLLGLTEDVGIEFEENAVATARAAGHVRWQVDVMSLECRGYAWPPFWLYIASPPCQTFSMAGKGSGREHMSALLAAVAKVAAGHTPESAIAAVADDALDTRSVLVLEPLRVIVAHRPRNVALEQVPPVLPIWEDYARHMRSMGYSVWTGILNAEQYGVPQTRRRAVLMASLDREVHPPAPTHSKFYPHRPDQLDDGVRPWVSMAEALGWGMTERPSVTVTGGGSATGGAEPFGNGARQSIRREVAAGRFALRGNQRPARASSDYQERPVEHPAQTLTSNARSYAFVQRSNYSAGGAPGSTAEERGRTERELAQPSVAITSKGFGWKSENDVVRVTVEEAGILQSFRPDYPWHGKKGAQFQQVGNAVPPLLAAAVVGALLGLTPA